MEIDQLESEISNKKNMKTNSTTIWIKENLKEYETLFLENDLDTFEALDMLDHSILQSLNITSIGKRLNILGIIKNRKNSKNSDQSVVLLEETNSTLKWSLKELKTKEFNEIRDLAFKTIHEKHKIAISIKDIKEISNKELESKFNKKKLELDCSKTVLKFHGTSEENIESICSHGFQLPETNQGNESPRALMFGKGIYFASDFSKSYNYTRDGGKMLICELILGKTWILNEANQELDQQKMKELGKDSVFAKGGSHEEGGVEFDEYVVYSSDQILPKYLIDFKTF
jgi:hypothetical protein